MGGNDAGQGRDGDAFDVVVMAASVGGLHALSTILSALPADFRAAMAIVQHRHPRRSSLLSAILGGRCSLSVRDALPSDRLRPGLVCLASPGQHLVVNADATLSLSDGPKVQFSRPSADRLFESAAVLGGRVIAVVLTGGNCDGADGVRAVKRTGGRVIAQDRDSSESFETPQAAIATGAVDWVLPLGGIAAALGALVREIR